MVNIVEDVIYKAFGFHIKSEIQLPELSISRNLDDFNRQAVISITIADLSEKWSELSEPNRYFVVKENLVMFQVQSTATFSIEDGNKIIVSPMAGSNEDQVRLYLLGSCMGALLFQRKILPLHGSAIAINGKAYAIVGDSGAGKSTLASAFLNRGYQLLSDDVIPVTLSNENVPIITPAYPQQKLWQESLHAFGMESTNLRPIVERETKFAIPVLSNFHHTSLPLSGVFELVKTDGEEISIHSINNLERLYKLFYHTYRNFIISRAGLMQWHFTITSTISTQISLHQIRRPISRFTAHDLTTLILTTIDQEERL